MYDIYIYKYIKKNCKTQPIFGSKVSPALNSYLLPTTFLIVQSEPVSHSCYFCHTSALQIIY